MVCHLTLLKVALHLSSYSLKGYLKINLQLKVTQQSRLLSVGLYRIIFYVQSISLGSFLCWYIANFKVFDLRFFFNFAEEYKLLAIEFWQVI